MGDDSAGAQVYHKLCTVYIHVEVKRIIVKCMYVCGQRLLDESAGIVEAILAFLQHPHHQRAI